MSDEIAVRAALPEVPTAESFGDLLGRYLWVNAVQVDHGLGYLRIDGNLKPDLRARDASALRRSFLDSLDAVMAILEAAGAKWARHPDVRMAGDVWHRIDGSWEFARMECRVDLHFRAGR